MLGPAFSAYSLTAGKTRCIWRQSPYEKQVSRDGQNLCAQNEIFFFSVYVKIAFSRYFGRHYFIRTLCSYHTNFRVSKVTKFAGFICCYPDHSFPLSFSLAQFFSAQLFPRNFMTTMNDMRDSRWSQPGQTTKLKPSIGRWKYSLIVVPKGICFFNISTLAAITSGYTTNLHPRNKLLDKLSVVKTLAQPIAWNWTFKNCSRKWNISNNLV